MLALGSSTVIQALKSNPLFVHVAPDGHVPSPLYQFGMGISTRLDGGAGVTGGDGNDVDGGELLLLGGVGADSGGDGAETALFGPARHPMKRDEADPHFFHA